MLTSSTFPMLAELYADSLALDWKRREGLLQSQVKTFADLQCFDVRLTQQLEALLLLGEVARKKFVSCMNEDALTRGEFFALCVYAFARNDDFLVDACIAMARSMPHLQISLQSALVWHGDFDVFEQWAHKLPIHIVWAVRAAFSWAGGNDIEKLVLDIFRSAGERDSELFQAWFCWCRCLPVAYFSLNFDGFESEINPGLRLMAGLSYLARLDSINTDKGVAVLLSLLHDGVLLPELQEEVLQAFALYAPEQIFRLWDGLCFSKDTLSQRMGIQALGWSGRLEAIPRLLERLSNPRDARLAGAAIMMITGSDSVRDGWVAREHPEAIYGGGHGAEIMDVDPDCALPWPSRERFVAWWDRNRSRFDSSNSYLLGRAITLNSVVSLLDEMPLGWRPFAANYIHKFLPQTYLLQTYLPALRQSENIQIIFKKGFLR